MINLLMSIQKKMWQIEDNRLLDDFGWSPKGVALKEGPREAWDTAISCYPYAIDGYNSYFKLATEKTNVLLNTVISNFDIINKEVVFGGERHQYDVIINTISPDTIFTPKVLPLCFYNKKNLFTIYDSNCNCWRYSGSS